MLRHELRRAPRPARPRPLRAARCAFRRSTQCCGSRFVASARSSLRALRVAAPRGDAGEVVEREARRRVAELEGAPHVALGLVEPARRGSSAPPRSMCAGVVVAEPPEDGLVARSTPSRYPSRRPLFRWNQSRKKLGVLVGRVERRLQLLEVALEVELARRASRPSRPRRSRACPDTPRGTRRCTDAASRARGSAASRRTSRASRRGCRPSCSSGP